MMMNSKAGQIVWHDLFTSNRERAVAFYGKVANWTYTVERATDFAWGGGEKDFVLALSGDEAGAGFAETPAGLPSGWIPYVEVPDVDTAIARADVMGAEIIRPPFEVPGVGRNALLRDPLGALVGVSLSRHSFPAPRLQFGPEVYLSNGSGVPSAFYADVFDWTVSAENNAEMPGASIFGPSGEPVASQRIVQLPVVSDAAWLPSIKVDSLAEAQDAARADGAECAGDTGPSNDDSCVFRDPDSALFVLHQA